MRLSKLILLSDGVHVEGETRRVMHGSEWDITVHPEGLKVRKKGSPTAHWVPAHKAESGEIVEEASAPVVQLPKRVR